MSGRTTVLVEGATEAVFPFTDGERDALELAYRSDYAGQRITFVADVEVAALLGLDTDYATLRRTGRVTAAGIEFEGRRSSAWRLAAVVSTAINRRCLYADVYLKAAPVTALETLEQELRRCMRRQQSEHGS